MNDATSRAAQAVARKREREGKQRLADAVLAVLQSPEGLMVLEWIVFVICQRDGVDFDPDSRMHAFKAGHRNAGLQITAKLIDLVGDQAFALEREHSLRRNERASARAAAEHAARRDRSRAADPDSFAGFDADS